MMTDAKQFAAQVTKTIGAVPAAAPKRRLLIDMKGIRKSYYVGRPNELEILHGIDLKVWEGEFVAIVGESGSGKSTLMNIIGVLDKPTAGAYTLDGIDIHNADDNELAAIRNRKIGFVFQTYNLIGRQSALKNVELPMLYAGVSGGERSRRAAEWLRRVGMGDRMKHQPNELSGGQKQRVWIAMALAQDTKVLFLDEPTTYLDIRYQLQILKLIRQLNREFGITIIMVLHDINQSLYYSDEIVAMKDGQMIAHGLPEEILTSELVQEVYDVNLDIRSVGGKPFVIPV